MPREESLRNKIADKCLVTEDYGIYIKLKGFGYTLFNKSDFKIVSNNNTKK